MQMMPADPFSLSTSIGGFTQDQQNTNPNPKPNPPPKKKRNLPGTPGHHHYLHLHSLIKSLQVTPYTRLLCCYFTYFSQKISYNRSRCRGHCSLPEDPHGNEPIYMRNMQQRVPERPEPSASPKGSQPSVEAKAKVQQRGKEEGLYLPRTNLRPPRPCKSTRRPHWHQKALQQKAR